jgi:hypothetical protein
MCFLSHGDNDYHLLIRERTTSSRKCGGPFLISQKYNYDICYHIHYSYFVCAAEAGNSAQVPKPSNGEQVATFQVLSLETGVLLHPQPPQSMSFEIAFSFEHKLGHVH